MTELAARRARAHVFLELGHAKGAVIPVDRVQEWAAGRRAEFAHPVEQGVVGIATCRNELVAHRSRHCLATMITPSRSGRKDAGNGLPSSRQAQKKLRHGVAGRSS
jgi:hypothetical protein